MSEKELKKVVNGVTKEVLSAAPFKEIFEGLFEIYAKLSAVDLKDFEESDISAITSKYCTAAEVSEIREAIAKELKKEFGKEHSFFVTTKIMLSLWALSVEIEETELCNNRERFCYKYVKRYDMISGNFEEALQNISLLD